MAYFLLTKRKAIETMDIFDDILNNTLYLGENGEGSEEVIPIISEIDDIEVDKEDLPETLPILPLRNNVIFPGIVMPITIGREMSLKLIKFVDKGDFLLGTVMQREEETEYPEREDLHDVGTIARVIKVIELPNGRTSAILQGIDRFSLGEFTNSEPYITAKVDYLDEVAPNPDSKEFQAIASALKDQASKISKLTNSNVQEAQFAIKNISSSTFLINFLSNNSSIKCDEKQELMEINELKQRGIKLASILAREVQILELKNDIQLKVKSDMDQQQREYILQQQMKTIQDELGGNPLEQEIEDLRLRSLNKDWNRDIKEIFDRELNKLQRLNPSSGEYSIQVGYLETMLDLPWNYCTEDNFDLKHAQKTLDADHYGLEKVKERIIEYLAVLKLKGNLKSPIICLHGAPGVGKTSLGKSIAKALGREYIRMSLGGLHDESEIRGHRKTYIGAMPGRIIQNIKKAGSANPVFILDELDKVTKSAHGDPASALLEVLDPEQNNTFHDNYLEIDYDLSKVMFVATANTVSTIHPALRDRMEMIDISGYLQEEKQEIAKRHLLPIQLENHGITKSQLSIPKAVLAKIIESYTRESGVRSLNKRLAQVARRVAKKVAFEETYNPKITPEDLKEYLGLETYTRELYEGNSHAGVVTGLAWTSVGGEILFIESSISRGNGKLSITGNIGDVMKESATIALEYLKSHSEDLGIDHKTLKKWDIHIHVPEGAVPKDGPSAGITITTALASLLTQRKVKKGLAMTGETTLRGRVLPVGGIKEKILAAKRSGIKEIVISLENKKDIEDIKSQYVKGVTFHYVENIKEVLSIALLDTKVANPINIDSDN